MDYREPFMAYVEIIFAIVRGEAPANTLRQMTAAWECLTIEQAEEAERIMQMLGVADAMD